jgi:LysR family D-serine deaminase transcriptional activator
MRNIKTQFLMPELYCFMRVSHYLSFTKAANELCITQGAASHRIRALEERLGFPLFERLPRKLAFTENGSRLYAIIKHHIGEIEEEIRSICTQNLEGSLNISTQPTFASYWLTPRLVSFAKRYKKIILNIRTRFDLVDFQTEAIDVAIYFGNGRYSGLDVVELMDEAYMPVCSASYADENNLWNNPEALKKCILLHDSFPWPMAQYYCEWKAWVDYFHLDIDCSKGYTFDRTDSIYDASAQGMGVAIGRKRMVSAQLATNRLVAPFEMVLPSPQSYFMVTTRQRAETTRVSTFRKWMLEQAQSNY